jgi:hypothetical protein
VSDSANPPSNRDDYFWPAVNNLLASASFEQVLAHALGPLEVFRRTVTGETIPEALAIEARMAAFAMLSVKPLLERVRNSCDGPLVLMKGPELALRYPGGARGFIDIDLLAPDAERAHEQLRMAGFIEAGDDAKFVQPVHHLRPLRWPELPLQVEIHSRPKWPDGLEAPTVQSIIGSARASDFEVEGILTPVDAQHALLVTAHAWAHQPLWRLRDLTDVRALARPSERAAIERTARAWSVTRLWRTTDRVTDAVLGRGRMPLLVRPWARHLIEQRERTVLENHLRDYMAGYWALPLTAAVAAARHAFAKDFLPAPEQAWSDKLSRMLTASRNANTPMSDHTLQLGQSAPDVRNRKRGDDDAL